MPYLRWAAAIEQIMDQLDASDAEIALSISLYIIFQGSTNIFWAAVTEIKGRKASILRSDLVPADIKGLGDILDLICHLCCQLCHLWSGQLRPSAHRHEIIASFRVC